MPQLGMNLQWWDQLYPIRYSADIIAGHITSNDLLRRQTVLTEAHVAGSGVFKVADLDPLLDQYRYTGHGYTTGDTIWVGNPGSAEKWQFRHRALPRTNELYFREHVSGADADFPAGSVIWAARGGAPWTNSQFHPAEPEYVKGGRRTGFPAGLHAGQIYRGQCNAQRYTNLGLHTITARGTGTLRVSTVGVTPQLYKTLNFIEGVPQGDPTFTLDESQFANNDPKYTLALIVEVTASAFPSEGVEPFHDLRIIAPDPAEHTGPSSVSLYAANASDPDYFLFRQDAVRIHEPFSPLRIIQPYGTDAGIDVTTWASRPVPTQGFGAVSSKGIPVEWFVKFANACNSDFWIDIPHRATLDYCEGLAAYVRDNLNPGLKCWVAAGNESWNFANPWVFGMRYYCAKFVEDISGTTITRSGTAATAVRKTAHGLAPGDTVTVTQSLDANFNGEFEVLSTPNSTTFTYAVANTGPTTATPRVDREIVSYKIEAATKTLPEASLNWQYNGSLTISIPNFLATLTDANPEVTLGTLGTDSTWYFRSGDLVLLSNFVEPEANGFYWFDLSASTGTATFTLPPRTKQGLPPLSFGANQMATRDGTFKIRQVIYNNVSRAADSEVVGDAAMRYQSRIGKVFADAMQAIAPGKIVPQNSTGVYTPEATIEKMVLELKAGGSTVPAGQRMGSAPYFQASGTHATDIGKLTGSIRAVSATFFTSAGGLATATLNYDHGLTTGDSLSIQNAAAPEYCGVVQVTVTGARTFTYPISGSPASPALAIGGTSGNPGSIWISRATTAFRELTSLTRSGASELTAVSRNHGYEAGDVIRFGGIRPRSYAGDRTVTWADADSFKVAVPSGLPDPVPEDWSTVGGTGRRIYTFRTATLTQMFADMTHYIDVTLRGRLTTQEAIFAREGIAHSCYEGGHHLTNSTGVNHNGLISLYNDVSDDPRFLDLMDLWWEMEADAGVESQNWFKIIGYHMDENWGLLRSMWDAESIKYPKALAMAAGGGPDPDPPADFACLIPWGDGQLLRLAYTN